MIPPALITGDVHLRDGPYRDDLAIGKRLLTDLKDVALREKCPYVIIAGDLFHSKKPSWDVVLFTYLGLKAMKKAGLTAFWCRGNHDLAIKSDPGHTIMSLFSDVCVPVLEPYKLEDESTVIWIIPWYEGPAYKLVIKAVHKYTLSRPDKKHYIISHIGIKEGQVTENFWVNQEVGSKDLCPELYQSILLGDYHYAQRIGDNIYYLGPPIPLDYATTEPNYNPWKMSWVTKEPEEVLLMRSYPKYCAYTVSEDSKIIGGYSAANRNRIFTPVDLAESVKLLYPEAEIHYQAAEASTVDRFDGINEVEWETTWAEFCSIKGIYETHFKHGLDYLNKVE